MSPDLTSTHGASSNGPALSLPDLQAHIRATILAPPLPDGEEPSPPAALLDAINDAGIPAARRLAIHRNHFATTLTDALGGIYEATRALLGPEFFDAFARHFARSHPPREPSLFHYGADFPSALAEAPGMADHQYVIEIAHLEWAMHDSFHAPAAPALAPTRLTALPANQIPLATLQAHPTARLLGAAFQVDTLWRGARDGAVDPEMLAPKTTHILLTRPELDVQMVRVSAPAYAFITRLCAGASIGEAAASAAIIDSDGFDLGETLGTCLAQGVFADVVNTKQI